MTDSLLTDEEIPLDPDKNYLEELVGDGKKFKTAEDLAKGKWHADQTVETYKRRMDELRQDYIRLRDENLAKARLEDLIDQLGQTKSNSENTPAKDEKPAMSEQDLESLMERKYQQIEAKRKADDNFNSVKTKLKDSYGDNYASVLKQRSQELGLTDQEVDDLARKSPKAFYKTFELDQRQQESFQAPLKTQRNDNFAPTGQKEKRWSYYQELKKSNPELYYDPKIGVEMAQEAVRQGEAFCDGNFYVKGLHERDANTYY